MCVVCRELEAMTGQWFYVVSAKNKQDRKSNEVACGSDIIRASIRTAKSPAPLSDGNYDVQDKTRYFVLKCNR